MKGLILSAVCLLSITPSAFATDALQSNSRADLSQLQAQSNTLDATLNQNEGGVLAKDAGLGTDWAKRVTISGELNVDGKWRTKNGRLALITRLSTLHYSKVGTTTIST